MKIKVVQTKLVIGRNVLHRGDIFEIDDQTGRAFVAAGLASKESDDIKVTRRTPRPATTNPPKPKAVPAAKDPAKVDAQAAAAKETASKAAAAKSAADIKNKGQQKADQQNTGAQPGSHTVTAMNTEKSGAEALLDRKE